MFTSPGCLRVFQEETPACAVAEPQQLPSGQAELPAPIAPAAALLREGTSNLARKCFFLVRRPALPAACCAAPAAPGTAFTLVCGRGACVCSPASNPRWMQLHVPHMPGAGMLVPHRAQSEQSKLKVNCGHCCNVHRHSCVSALLLPCSAGDPRVAAVTAGLDPARRLVLGPRADEGWLWLSAPQPLRFSPCPSACRLLPLARAPLPETRSSCVSS